MHAHFRMIRAVEHGLHKEWMDGATLPALVKVGERAKPYIQLEHNVFKFPFNDQLQHRTDLAKAYIQLIVREGC